LEPRKGVASLVSAFDRIASARPDVVLVLGGQAGWGMEATERALDLARHRDRVVRTGYLPDAAVPALLRCAAVVAYPALEEGFGLPALEALACAAPLVTTEGTAMAEFAGDAACWCPRVTSTRWPMRCRRLSTRVGTARGRHVVWPWPPSTRGRQR